MWQRIKLLLSPNPAQAPATPWPGEEQASARRPARLFCAVLVLYVLYQIAMQPGWILGGEMWAEMATNYFRNAQSPELMQKLFATDAGYVPVPPRMLALVAALLSLPAAAIPYFYTGSALLFAAVMVGAFCLRDFRALVPSDPLRFLTALAILVVTDFETRTFINFTYFAAFFVTIVTALAWVQRERALPAWAWSLPVLVVSKPAVLAALPAMVVVALRAGTRFRRITLTALACCAAQVACMALHKQDVGTIAQAQGIPLSAKLMTTVKYFIGLVGTYLPGPDWVLPADWILPAGGIGVVLMLGLCRLRRHPAGTLVVLGLGLLLFNMLINAFALPGDWNSDMAKLGKFSVYRHMIVGLFGCTLAMSGLVAMLFHYQSPRLRHLALLAPPVFFAWVLMSGWLQVGLMINRAPVSPTIDSGHWQRKAPLIDANEPGVCVPLDPFSWGIFGRQCAMLNPAMDMGLSYRVIHPGPDGKVVLEWEAPPAVQDRDLISMGLLVRPATRQQTLLTAQATVTAASGEPHRLSGSRTLSITGGMLLLEGPSGTSVPQPRRVLVEFNQPVEVRYSANEQPTALWMGPPRAP